MNYTEKLKTLFKEYDKYNKKIRKNRKKMVQLSESNQQLQADFVSVKEDLRKLIKEAGEHGLTVYQLYKEAYGTKKIDYKFHYMFGQIRKKHEKPNE